MGLGQGDRGYAMAALLVAMSIMAVMMSVAMPVWTHYVQREREEELIWRGQQYARAVMLWQRKFANTFPPTVDVLVEQKFLRKKYKDPITNEDFQVVPPTGVPMPGAPGSNASPSRPAPRMTSLGTNVQAPGVAGVVSKSTKTSIKVVNGRTKHNEWIFMPTMMSQQVGVPNGAGQRPGTQTGPGQNPQSPSPFSPMGGSQRRPDVNQSPFGRPPTPGSPPPFGQPQPFGQPRPGGQQPPRPPGN
jgi:type II secretory pathway pseudopilin PulG